MAHTSPRAARRPSEHPATSARSATCHGAVKVLGWLHAPALARRARQARLSRDLARGLGRRPWHLSLAEALVDRSESRCQLGVGRIQQHALEESLSCACVVLSEEKRRGLAMVSPGTVGFQMKGFLRVLQGQLGYLRGRGFRALLADLSSLASSHACVPVARIAAASASLRTWVGSCPKSALSSLCDAGRIRSE